jgi:GGDEF domain-containing protein
MQLNNLNTRLNKLRLLYESDDTGQPLESSRYPKVNQHTIAKYTPAIDIEEEIDALRAMAFEYPKGQNPPDYEEAVKSLRRSQAAFRRLLQRLQLNPMSGLRGEGDHARLSSKATKSAAVRKKFGKTGPGEYIVIAADVDDMKFLNDKTGLGHAGVNAILQNIGRLFKESFQVENTKLFHPHGDEFRVISHIGSADQEGARLRFARLLQGCLEVSNKLASTGFYLEGWPNDFRVQPTISFGISTTELAADGLLTHVKTGASSGKPMKFVIVVDRDLRYDLGFSPEEMNKYVTNVAPSAGAASVMTLDSPEVAVYESKLPLDQVRDRQGPVVLECSWSENPRKEELAKIRRQKIAYLDQPGGVMKLGKHYLPLKEAYKPSR